MLSNIFLLKKPGVLADELKRLVDFMSDFGATSRESDTEPALYFFHGLESAPHGSKYHSLLDSYRVFSPDFQDMDIWERLEKIEHQTRNMQDLIIVGSSYGGLLASLLYSRHPERIRGLVLMAPAMHLEAAAQIEEMPDDAVVIHAPQDKVVPIEAVRKKCDSFGIEIVEVDDNHRLRKAHKHMLDGVRKLQPQTE